MIAYDLLCRSGDHRFEGWFASSAEFDRQKHAGLLACPVCGSCDVAKAVMAPNVARKGNQAVPPPPAGRNDDAVTVANMPQMPAEMIEAIGKIAEMQAKMLEKSDWVGDRFADEARAIHYGDAPDRIIHGNATVDDARDLHDEGISVAPLPLPFVPPEAKN
jgi:hypothetical protein